MDPHTATTPLVCVWSVLSYALAAWSSGWAGDAACTLALGLRINPLITGLLITNLMGVLPLVIFVTALSYMGQTNMAAGVTLGGGWLIAIIPMALAGLKVPFTARPSWISIDLPILIGCCILFIYSATSADIGNSQAFILLAICAGYVVLKYIQAQTERYNISSFGKNFIFGISVVGTLFRLATGLAMLIASGFYLGLVFTTAGAKWHLPVFPLGFIAALPFCLFEIRFAYAAVKTGQGELLPGHGVWLGLFNLLIGGAIIEFFGGKADPNCFNFLPIGLVAVLVYLWLFLRIRQGSFRGIIPLLLSSWIILLAIAWAQSYGLLTGIALPQTFDTLQ